MNEQIEKFLSATAFAVAGASNRRHKYGNKVLRCYMQHNKKVYPLNPIEKVIEGLACFNRVEDLPDGVEGLSIITPASVTEKIIPKAAQKGIKNIWMQPGAESDRGIQLCHEHGINVIAGGPCILVVLGYTEKE